ncbi:hypothetical protein C5Y96_12090 [Blastopirellula marina]|uniref:Uncharacterized protein n=1 Tax=Blastopirellula marina TaxID=124 RepID=A0A2S8FG05_9BACT|nr:hypothetical protein C5Y96_12090 [Blastopirellula marina]RCS51485.1 hypothetical protein DTL36_12100 [Bremerella cremea]
MNFEADLSGLLAAEEETVRGFEEGKWISEGTTGTLTFQSNTEEVVEKVLVLCARMSTSYRLSTPLQTTNTASELVDAQVTGKQRLIAKFFTTRPASFDSKITERNAPERLLVDSSQRPLTTTTLSKN